MTTGLQSLQRELHLQWKADGVFFLEISSVAQGHPNSAGHVPADSAINIANTYKAFF